MTNLINFVKSNKISSKIYLNNCTVIDIKEFKNSETMEKLNRDRYMNTKTILNTLKADLNKTETYLFSQLTQKQRKKIYWTNTVETIAIVSKISKSEKIHTILRTMVEIMEKNEESKSNAIKAS